MNIVYARVSNTKQKDDLDRQIDLIKNYIIDEYICHSSLASVCFPRDLLNLPKYGGDL